MSRRFPQLPQQVEDLCLDRRIERRGGFVGDQDLRIAGQRHGDHGALLHAAGELVRKLTHAPFGSRNADLAKQRDRAIMRFAPGHAAMQDQRLGDLIANTFDRVQASSSGPERS